MINARVAGRAGGFVDEGQTSSEAPSSPARIYLSAPCFSSHRKLYNSGVQKTDVTT